MAFFTNVYASNYLFFAEGQFAANYNTTYSKVRYFSHHEHHPMQKPSLGFDYIQRFSSPYRDWGRLAIQARVNLNPEDFSDSEFYLFNAYFNYKFNHFDVWIGHNKPVAGLNTFLDNHAALMTDFTMIGFALDRDWGFGLEKDSDFLQLKFSLTTGSEMKFSTKGSYLAAGKIEFGDYLRHNSYLGISVMYGEVLKTMGYKVMHDGMKHPLVFTGFDTAVRYLNYEFKSDFLIGEYHNRFAWAGLIRASVFLLGEDKFNLESQVIVSEKSKTKYNAIGGGVSYRLTPFITLRSVYDYEFETNTSRYVFQFYYYKPIKVL
jgi:hypothetical protein